MKFEYELSALSVFLLNHDQLLPFVLAMLVVILFVAGMGAVIMWCHTHLILRRMSRESMREKRARKQTG